MANIPLAEIPNAPSLDQMARPQLENATSQGIDMRMERNEIRSSFASMEQNPSNAGLVGSAVAGLGGDVYKAASSLQQKQQELSDAAARAEFASNYSLENAKFDSTLDPTRPETWAAARSKWNNDVLTPMYQALPDSAKASVYPDFIRAYHTGIADIGVRAFKQNIANNTDKTLQAIGVSTSSGQFDQAFMQLDELHKSNAINDAAYKQQYTAIQGAQQKAGMLGYIQQDPSHAASILKEASETGVYPKEIAGIVTGMDPKEVYGYAKQAEALGNYKTAHLVQGVQSMMDDPSTRPATLQALKESSAFQQLPEDAKPIAVDSYLNKYVSGTPEGAENTVSAMNAVKQYTPANDGDWSKYYEISKQIAGTVPAAERGPLLTELQKKHDQFLENGGRAPYNHDINSGISGQLTRMFTEGAFDGRNDQQKGTPEYNAEVQKGFFKFMRYSQAWDKIQAENPDDYKKALQDFSSIIAPDDAKNAIRSIQAPPPAKPSFMQRIFGGGKTSSTDEGWIDAPQGSRVTEYWPGENGKNDKAATVGIRNNQLTNDSLAISPDIQQKMASEGFKPGDKVQIKISNGKDTRVVVKQYDDHTANDDEAKSLGLSPLRGRFDYRVPRQGASGVNGYAVISYRKLQEG